MALSEELKDEALAFGRRIDERVQHGHLPDLRRVQPCDWFYNNTWRRPYLVKMDCGRAFNFALGHARKTRLLDVGCGPGHMSLEFARNGFDVVGVDISQRCLEVAQQVLDQNPYKDGFGSVRYVNNDFLSLDEPAQSFDTICFFGSLHHFDRPEQVLDKALALLKREGRIVVMEPARDWLATCNGTMVSLIRLLLSVQGLWYESLPFPLTREEVGQYIDECLTELRMGYDKHEGKQSPHDNACGAERMLTGLRTRFTEIECRSVNGLVDRIVGGVRGRSEEETRRIAEFLDLFDQVAIENGTIQPGVFYWAGEKTLMRAFER